MPSPAKTTLSAIAAIKVPFAVVVIAHLSRASALSSAARLATQRGPLGLTSRRLARQSVQAALANPLCRPAPPLALPLGRSRRLLCSGGAPEAPPPARPPGCSLAPSAALERPQVDLLPISDEWKERLRSLTRPAASAMVRRLDAASPLCYRLDKDVAGVRDPLQLAAFAGDVERVEELLEREEGGALPSAMRKKLRGTAQAFLEARVAAEEAILNPNPNPNRNPNPNPDPDPNPNPNPSRPHGAAAAPATAAASAAAPPCAAWPSHAPHWRWRGRYREI